MDIINKLTNLFSDFPTIGPRTAGRFVYYLMKQPKTRIEELTSAILELKQKIKFCSFCLNPHDTDNLLCPICLSHNRNKSLLCVVEKEQDLEKIEETKKYNGLYFIFGVLSSSYKNPETENLKLEALRQRVKNPEKFFGEKIDFSEIIIATNPTPEGINTSVLVERVLREIQNGQFSAQGGPASGWKITHLARGIPIGGELEYADEETLESALEGRK